MAYNRRDYLSEFDMDKPHKAQQRVWDDSEYVCQLVWKLRYMCWKIHEYKADMPHTTAVVKKIEAAVAQLSNNLEMIDHLSEVRTYLAQLKGLLADSISHLPVVDVKDNVSTFAYKQNKYDRLLYEYKRDADELAGCGAEAQAYVDEAHQRLKVFADKCVGYSFKIPPRVLVGEGAVDAQRRLTAFKSVFAQFHLTYAREHNQWV
jgi:hypothetical protein